MKCKLRSIKVQGQQEGQDQQMVTIWSVLPIDIFSFH